MNIRTETYKTDKYIEEETTLAVSRKYLQYSSDPNIPLKKTIKIFFFLFNRIYWLSFMTIDRYI